MGLLSNAINEKKYDSASGKSSGSSSASGSSYSSSSSSSSNIWEDKQYNQYANRNQKRFSTGTDAVNYLGTSSLFDRNIVDGAYAITDITKNTAWGVDVDIDGDGVIEDGVAIADAIAASFDSELDLYIQEHLESIFRKYKCQNMRQLFGDSNSPAIIELARLGIRADGVGDDKAWQNRTYSFSLVELPDNVDEISDKDLLELVYSNDAKILEDKQGKKGSIIFSDCLIPDGVANGAEINLASILDTMGYDCFTKADFVDNPDEYYELLNDIDEKLLNGYYTSSGTTHSDIYGDKTKHISDAVNAVYSQGIAYVAGWAYDPITFTGTRQSYKAPASMGNGITARNSELVLPGSGTFVPISGEGASGKDGDSSLVNKDQKEAESEKDIKAAADKILNQKINEYKKENGETPKGSALRKLEDEALREAKVGV